MTDLDMTSVLWPVGLVALLLVAGGVWGHAVQAFIKWGMPDARARTLGMRGALGAAAAATAIVVAVAVRHLVVCQGIVATSCARTIRAIPIAASVRGLPSLDLSLRVDGLSSLFLLMVAFCGGCIAVYSFGWLRENPFRHDVAGSFSLFLLATMLTVVVNNVLWLFIALEVMTICSGDLVRFRGRMGGPVAASRTAVRTYMFVSHVGLIFLVVGLLPIVVKHSTLELNALSSAGGSPIPALSFVLVLIGLAMRSGVAPFHFWVPTVHPQLPTNTHAMMSAVMLKIPVYLMIRFFFEGIIGPVAWWWGALLLVLAGVTAVVTVFYAMVSTDLKVALAYHSVENIGIILAGLGLSLLFSDPRFADVAALRAAAALALAAGLYHVINHALFKSLLFLAAGSIEQHVGTVDLRQLGGLLRRLPWTAGALLVGAMAIAELPPLNGFISVWLTLQSMFSGQAVFRTDAPVALSTMAALVTVLVTLAVAFAATTLAFVKISGESLLGEPRSDFGATPESWPMRAVLVVLSALCLLLGLQPWLLVPWLSEALEPLHDDLSGLTASPTQLVVRMPAAPGVHPYSASLSMIPLFLLIILPVFLSLAIRTWRWARRPVWVGGQRFVPSAMQYRGSALTALLWEPISRQRNMRAAEADDLSGESAGRSVVTGYGPLPVEVRMSPRRTVLELANYLYNRLIHVVLRLSEQFGRRVQNGDVRRYVLYILAMVILVLLILAAGQ